MSTVAILVLTIVALVIISLSTLVGMMKWLSMMGIACC